MFRRRRPDGPAVGVAMCGFVLVCPAC